MALKRKRSSQTFSSPFSDSSSASVASSDTLIPFYYQYSKPAATEPVYHKATWSFPAYEEDHSSSLHLNSRTRKRHRDDRPDEQTVYCVSCWLGAIIRMNTLANICRCAASTINKLYEAQRRHPDAAPVPSQQTLSVAPQPTEKPQRSTLHSFWRLPQQPSTSTAMAVDPGPGIMTSNLLELRCEDCERPLRNQDAMELDDGMLEQETACGLCRRHVCDTCAVLGNERICLACASRAR